MDILILTISIIFVAAPIALVLTYLDLRSLARKRTPKD